MAAGWTLIEMLGVLALMALAAAALVPTMVREADAAARQAELRDVEKVIEALERGIRRQRRIPDEATWASVAATDLGRPPGTILTNLRGGPRTWITDPRLQIGQEPTGSLPYVQSDTGSLPPQNARMVLISSLGDPWPVAGATNVSLTGEQFDALWNGRAGSVPEILQWDGAGEDLILGRLDLREQFVPVVLTRSAGEAPAFFGVDRLATNPMPEGVFEAWYLRGSVLRLHGDTRALQSSVMLHQPLAMTFERGAWRGRPSLRSAAGHWTGPAVDEALDRFLGAPENPGGLHAASPADRDAVVRSLRDFFEAYLDWAAHGFPQTGPDRVAVVGAVAQLDLTTAAHLHQP